MLTRLQVQDLRALRSVDCSFGRFSCVVGPNGCGKSTLLEALSWVVRLSGTGHVGSGGNLPDGCHLQAEFAARKAGPPFVRGVVQRPAELSASWMYRGSNLDDASARQQALVPVHCLVPRFSLDLLKQPTSINQQRRILPESGEGLAGLLADWKLEDDPRLERVAELLRAVVPHVRGLKTARNGDRYELWFLVGPQQQKVPARDMSTGTLYALALLVMMESLGDQSSLVLIDDVDRDLHPEAQRSLIEHLRAMLDARPELQIVVTSHSPYLVDQFLPSEVLVMALDDEGFSHIAPMTSHADFPRLGGAMTPGEFWSAVGERWILPSSRKVAS